MSRKPRLIIPQVPVHITQRGNRKEDIFRDDEDKEKYIRSFQFYRKKYKVKLYAWCLMDNHVHFVVEPQNQKGLSRLFCALNTKYVRYFQKKYGESGRLFGDRYFSSCLDEEHFYEAIRYVELNPFVAKMESKPGEYYWSSALERLKTRSLYYLHTLPTYFEVNNWWEYLTEKLDFTSVWTVIKKATISGKPIGGNVFLHFLKSCLSPRQYDSIKMYRIPVGHD
jgi:putative transposase|tara:strand:+ start:247 stop:918 length:672 start_codon:yes stop_codon:yes gene_type:complete